MLEFCWHDSWSIGADITPQARASSPWRTARAILEATMFRISRPASDEIIDVVQVDEIEPAIRASERGRYHAE
jgi:hypothetical protein